MNNKVLTKNTEKEIIRRFHLKAQDATPGPPLGSQLSFYKLPVMQLSKEFNEKTKQFVKGTPVIAIVYIQKNKSGYSARIEVRIPTVSALLKEFLGIKKFSSAPGKDAPIPVSMDIITKIAEIKLQYSTASSLEAEIRTIIATAKSHGLTNPEF